MSNRRAAIALADIRRAARVARDEGVRVTLELPDGVKFHVERETEEAKRAEPDPWEDA